MVANGMEGVPWMVGGGAKHSANVGRVLAYMAVGGAAGIASPGDLKVSPSSTPDGFVHVSTGALSLVNLEGNARNEAYIGRGTGVSDVAISPTGSSARSDLVVLRVRDPQYGYSAPTSVADGPYIFPEVVPGVPAGTKRADQVASLLGKAVYAVARIDVPANTSAITSGMIKDLRRLATPHYDAFNDLQVGPATLENVTTTDTSWKNFPSNTTSVDVPIWATHADVDIMIGVSSAGAADMITRVNLGGITGPTSGFDINDPGTNGDAVLTQHSTQAVGLDVRSLAGQTVTLRLNAMRVLATQATGAIAMDKYQQVKFRVEFFERPI